MALRVSLTFDDGPNLTATPRVLDLLEKHHIVASFFLIAQNITPASAEMVRRALSLGCEIENHSVTHSHMSQMSPEEIRSEIAGCSRSIEEITGRRPEFFRPPYIDVSPTLFENVDLTFICGSGCEDWIPEVPADVRAARTLANAKDGELFLLHDSENNFETVKALETVIPALLERGATFHTARGLFEACGILPAPGRLYSNVFQTG